MYNTTLGMLLLLVVGWWLRLSVGCNQAICASIVSKCMLLKSCECDLSDSANCECCKKCYACLGHLFDECCSCVGLCKSSSESGSFSNVSATNSQNLASQVSKLLSPDESLFLALTNYGDDLEGRWTSISFPVDVPSSEFHKYPLLNPSPHQETFLTLNCTVTYLTQCRSMNKCKRSCESMGAASFRWFHDSCCECVGSSCVDYGLDETRCAGCPEHEDEIELTPEELRLLKDEFVEEHLLYEEESVLFDDGDIFI